MTSPARVSRSHRGEDGPTEPGKSRAVVGVVVLHPDTMGAGDHHGRIGGSLARARFDDDSGLGPRSQPGLQLRTRLGPSDELKSLTGVPESGTYAPESEATLAVRVPFPASVWCTNV